MYHIIFFSFLLLFLDFFSFFLSSFFFYQKLFIVTLSTLIIQYQIMRRRVLITLVIQVMTGVGTPFTTHCMFTVLLKSTSSSPDFGTVSTVGESETKKRKKKENE